MVKIKQEPIDENDLVQQHPEDSDIYFQPQITMGKDSFYSSDSTLKEPTTTSLRSLTSNTHENETNKQTEGNEAAEIQKTQGSSSKSNETQSTQQKTFTKHKEKKNQIPNVDDLADQLRKFTERINSLQEQEENQDLTVNSKSVASSSIEDQNNEDEDEEDDNFISQHAFNNDDKNNNASEDFPELFVVPEDFISHHSDAERPDTNPKASSSSSSSSSSGSKNTLTGQKRSHQELQSDNSSSQTKKQTKTLRDLFGNEYEVENEEQNTKKIKEEEETSVPIKKRKLGGKKGGLKALMKEKKPSNTRIVGGRRVPESAAKLLGEANTHYFKGDYPTAVELYKEVIRQAPNLPFPYHSLGLIFEDLNDIKKAMEFYMIAAHLTPTDVELWQRLAELSKEQGNIRQAAYCLSKVVSNEPHNVDPIWDRAQMYLSIGEWRRAATCLKQITRVKPEDEEAVIELCKLYHHHKEYDNAVSTLERSVNSRPRHVGLTTVNMLAELYMLRGSFKKTIDMISKVGTAKNDQELPPEILTKYGISYAYLGEIPRAESIFRKVLALPVDKYPDLFYDIAETYVSIGEQEKAASLYEKLQVIPEYDKPGVWLKLGRCFQALKQTKLAIKYFEKVIEEVPDNVEASLFLSQLYKDTGETDKALDVLKSSAQQRQNPEQLNELVIDLRILIQKGWLHLSEDRYPQFIEVCLPVVYSILEMDNNDSGQSKRKRSKMKHDPTISFKEDGNILTFRNKRSSSSTTEDKKSIIQKEKGTSSNDREDDNNSNNNNNNDNQDKKGSQNKKEEKRSLWTWNHALEAFGMEELFHFLVLVIKALTICKRYDDAMRVVNKLINSGKIVDDEQMHQLRFLAVGVAFHAEDYLSAYDSVKYVLSEKPYSIPLWNLFNKIITRAGNFDANRKFMLRLLKKHPQSVPLMVLVGHNCLMSGSYRLALGEYFRAYKMMPDEPLISLSIGIAYLNLVMNRRSANRNMLVMQAFAFLYQYHRQCHSSQEANYNLGRAFHQLNLLHLAVPYYDKVLKASGKTANEAVMRQAAYNLSLIYKKSGNKDLARQVLVQHLTV